MTRDHADEIVTIELSRMQRETLERWLVVLADAGEFAHAEKLRYEIPELELEEAA